MGSLCVVPRHRHGLESSQVSHRSQISAGFRWHASTLLSFQTPMTLLSDSTLSVFDATFAIRQMQ